MTVKGFLRFVVAYIAATLAVAALALAIAEVFKNAGLTFWLAFLGLWCITVGIMGVSWTMRRLASTLGIEFDVDKAWDERKQLFQMSGKFVKTTSITQSAEADKEGKWTTAVAVAVFIL